MKNVVLLAICTMLAANQVFAQLKVNELNPEPNINMSTTELSLGLSIDETILNDFIVPKQNGVKKAKVTAWRTSLEKGFNNGFSDFFKISSPNSDPDGILNISKAEIEFVPAAVSGYAGTVAIRSQIKYRAEWKSRGGEVLKRMAGTAESKSAVTSPRQTSSNVENAMETMYEQIAYEMNR